jgi:ATP-dependent Clp protease ATP-binding subunit ClpB
MLDPNSFTEKSRQALVAAQQLAQSHQHPQVEPAHLALVLFQDEGGLARRLAEKAGADPREVERQLEQLVRGIPSQSPPPTQLGLSADLARVIQEAQKAQAKHGDSHLAVEHLVATLAAERKLASLQGRPEDGDR